MCLRNYQDNVARAEQTRDSVVGDEVRQRLRSRAYEVLQSKLRIWASMVIQWKNHKELGIEK